MRLHACVPALALVLTSAAAAQTPPPSADPVAADPAAAEAALDAAAAEGQPAPAATRDPLEGFNRAMWGFNRGLDKIVMRPAAIVYRTVTPKPARRGISKIFANLNEPWSFVNNLLQGKVGRAFNNLGRFVVNTTIGVGGLADHATDLGLRPTPEDFGQTLAVWGVKSSAYLVLPLFGPSTVRDGVGSGVAMFADPYPICLRACTDLTFPQRLGIQAGEIVSIRSDLIDSGTDAFLDTSLDSYAAARSAYLQGRAADIADADPGDADGGVEAPVSLDPTAADSPPAEPPAGAPATTAPASPEDTPAPADTTPAEGVPTPKLSFNLTGLEG